MRNALALIGAMVVVCLFSTVTVALAQVPSGVIDGLTMDWMGEVGVPTVMVEISGPALMFPRETMTGPEGSFRFEGVRPGVYSVFFYRRGFKALVRENIVVSLNSTTTITVLMQPGTVSEVIRVAGESPIVDVRYTNVGFNFKDTMLEDIPNARDVWVVLEDVPSMVMETLNVGGAESGTQSRFSAGSGPTQNVYNYDGIDITDMAVTGSGTHLPYDAFEEVQVSTSAHTADVAAPGVYLNIVRRSGSDEFHGVQSFYYEGTSLQSNNVSDGLLAQGYDSGTRVHRYVDFTFSLGGRLAPEKLWFYGLHQQQRPEVEPIGFVTPEGDQGIDSVTLKYWLIKLDWQVDAQNKISASYEYSPYLRPYRDPIPYRYLGPGTLWDQDSSNHIPQVHWTSIIGNSGFLEASFGNRGQGATLQPDEWNENAVSLYEYRSGPFAAQPLPDWQRGYHQSYSVYDHDSLDRWQLTTAFSWFEDGWAGGDHSIKLGFNYFRFDSDSARDSFGGTQQGYRYGLPYNLRIENLPRHTWFSENSTGFYVQDSLQIGDRITLNLGLRGDAWEVYLPPQSTSGSYHCGALGDRWPQFCSSSHSGQRDLVSWFNLAPRLGIVFDLRGDGRTAFKANFGRYYHQIGNWVADFVNPHGLARMLLLWSDANGDNLWQPEELAPGPYSVRSAAANAIDPGLEQPMTDEWVFGFDHELSEDISLAATLTLKTDKRLAEDVAVGLPYSAYSPRSFQHPDVPGGTFIAYELAPDYVGNVESRLLTNPGIVYGRKFESTYRGLTLRAAKRMSRDWQMLGSYTWSKSEGFREWSAYQATTFLDTPNDDILAFGRHFWDRPHAFKISGSYNLPGGVKIGGYLRYQSGEPYAREIETPERLNQGFVIVRVESPGEQRLPAVGSLALRASKVFDLPVGSIEAIADLFNAFNTGTTTQMGTVIDDVLGDITKTLSPRILRLGVRWVF